MQEHSYLNELERESIVRFNQDTIMKGAVEKAMLHFIYSSGILKPGVEALKEEHWVYALPYSSQEVAHNDEALGRMLRTKLDASAMLKSGFDNLANFKPTAKEPVEIKENPGA